VLARDWRPAPPEVLAPLLASEARRWRDHLAWDTASVWSRVEDARRSGDLPGLLVRDSAGRVRGWSFHLLHEDTLQVGALTTDDEEATTAWLEALLDTPEAIAAQRWICFGWFDSPGVFDSLTAAGLDVQRYHYLQRELSYERHHDGGRSADAGGLAIRAWQSADGPAITRLLAAGYPGSDHTRPFAPAGTTEEWDTYCRQIVEADANGVFDATLSAVVPGSDGRLDAAALMTRLASTTAHVAQFVVRPECHGRGVGRALLAHTLDRARAAGCETATLLVSERNQRARALYRSAGFIEQAVFLSATGTPSGTRNSEFAIQNSERDKTLSKF
jgi:ribosomal protein S18 acetylase RimI-like enzyme